MSMLAAPRRKQRVINLRAKNSEWSNDKNKFGQRMLEKMGWSEGRGLGAKENGMVEHVVARYKCDEKGLGYVDKNDQWTKHEDDFNALLANLSNGSSEQNQSQESLHSGKSLESKSKKSKARIHYHKFTRGKDLARYSEKDLANIFGKKTLKSNENEELEKEDDSTEKVFTEKGSMYDYFKSKLENLKTGSKSISTNNDEEENILDHNFQGFSNKICNPDDSNETEKSNNLQKAEPFSFYPSQTVCNSTNDADLTGIEDDLKKSKKKKKKSKCKEDISEITVNHDLLEDNEPNDSEQLTVKKSKKKNKKESLDRSDRIEVEKVKKTKKKDKVVEDISIEPPPKKKKKNKDHF